jgi:hypothetical protein
MHTLFPQSRNDWRLRQTQAERNASQTRQVITMEDVCYALSAIEGKVGVDNSDDSTSLDARITSAAAEVVALDALNIAYVNRANNFSEPQTIAVVSGRLDGDAGGSFALLVKRTDGTSADGFYTVADVEMILRGGSSAYLGARAAQHSRVMVKDQSISGSAIAYRGTVDFWTANTNTGDARAFEAELQLWAASGSFALSS